MAVTVTSQLTSAVGVILLPLVMARSSSDEFATYLQAGYIGLASIVWGVVYNLTIGRPGFSHWGWIRVLTMAASAAFVVPVGLHLGTRSVNGLQGQQVAMLLAFSIGSTSLASSGVSGVRLACNARPLPLAGSSIGANLGFLIGALVVAADAKAYSAPGIGWCIGGIATDVIFRLPRFRTTTVPTAGMSPIGHGLKIHAAALCLGTLSSGLAPVLFLLTLESRPSGTATFVFLALRVGSSLIGFTVNSVLLNAYHWSSQPTRLPRLADSMFIAALCLASVALGIGLLATGQRADLLVSIPLTFALLVSLAGGAISNRHLNASRKSMVLLAKVFADMALIAGVLIVLRARPSAEGVLAGFMMSQGVTGAASAFSRRRPIGMASTVLLVIVSMALAYTGGAR